MKKGIFLLFTMITIGSCGYLVEDLNNNPNSPTSASYQYILTGTQVGNTVLHTGESTRKAGIFCGYYTGLDRNHLSYSRYAVTTNNFNSEWNNVYVDVLVNSRAAEEAAREEGIGEVTIGISQVIRAMALGTATSLWEDIPFDEGGLPEIVSPIFEDQLAVYAKLQDLLDVAIANFNTGNGRPASNSDIHFDGDPDSWVQVAYTLKARYYMHTGEYEKAYTAALNGVSSFAGNLRTLHGTADDNANLNYQFFAIAVRQSDLVTSDFMTSLIAPEMSINPDFTNYRGNDKTDETGRYNYLFQITEHGTQPNTANGFAAQQEPSYMVPFRENLLILAEAGFRSQGFDKGLEHLNEYRSFLATGGYMTNAKSSDLKYDAYEPADFESGGMENTDGISKEDALLREILEERYVSFFGQLEGFNDTRRTEKETLVRVNVVPNEGSQLPQRFLYPTTEIDRNENVPDPIPDFFEPMVINQ